MAEPLKNQYSTEYIQRLAAEIKKHYPAFELKAFSSLVLNSDWPQYELKQRMRHIVRSIHAHLPFKYHQQIEILKKVAPTFGSFTGMLFPDFVEVYGMDHPDVSIPALELFTQYSSSEFAVRPFTVRYPEKMVDQHLNWAQHENHHVRRLATEGIRPRLPWAMALPNFKKDPAPIIPILEKLKKDKSEYVRKSVANNLNDISKDHPELVLKIAKKWLGQSKETDWIVRHACRGLLKKGDVQAMNLFGFEVSNTEVKDLKLSTYKIKIGGEFSFEFVLKSDQRPEKLKLAYQIDFLKKNGKSAGKVFHLAEVKVENGEEILLKKKHAFKDLTTRQHNPGKHKLSILINGKSAGAVDFELT